MLTFKLVDLLNQRLIFAFDDNAVKYIIVDLLQVFSISRLF